MKTSFPNLYHSILVGRPSEVHSLCTLTTQHSSTPNIKLPLLAEHLSNNHTFKEITLLHDIICFYFKIWVCKERKMKPCFVFRIIEGWARWSGVSSWAFIRASMTMAARGTCQYCLPKWQQHFHCWPWWEIKSPSRFYGN